MSSPPPSTASGPGCDQLSRPERREQLLAGVVAGRRLATAQQLKLTQPAQDERVLVDVVADGDVEGVRADAGCGHGRATRHASSRLRRELLDPCAQLELDPREERGR